MDLYYSNYSVASRKVRIAIEVLALTDQIEFIPIHAENNLFIGQRNPLKQVPVLVIDQDESLFDSRTILPYLNSMAPKPHLYPEDTRSHLKQLRLEALADGLVPLIDQIVEEGFRPIEQQSSDLIEQNWQLIYASIEWLEQHFEDFNALNDSIFIGEIAVACSLDYLGFKFRKEVQGWQAKYPRVGQWFDAFKKKELMQSTKYHSI